MQFFETNKDSINLAGNFSNRIYPYPRRVADMRDHRPHVRDEVRVRIVRRGAGRGLGRVPLAADGVDLDVFALAGCEAVLRELEILAECLVDGGEVGERLVGLRDGIAVADLSGDQKELVQQVLRKLIEPYRQSDRDEVVSCLKEQGGIDQCSLAFYTDNDLGSDRVWDNWRLEGPSFVWYFRGVPHVHVWVNVANSAAVKLNAAG